MLSLWVPVEGEQIITTRRLLMKFYMHLLLECIMAVYKMNEGERWRLMSCWLCYPPTFVTSDQLELGVEVRLGKLLATLGAH